jgi:hypothetical protein
MRGRRLGSCPALTRCGSRKADAEKLDSLSRQGVSTTSTTGAGLGSIFRGASIEMSDRIHLVKANPDAQGFFSANGLQQLSIVNAGRDYPYRFWRDLRAD